MSAYKTIPSQKPFAAVHAMLSRTFKGRSSSANQICVKKSGEMIFSQAYGNTGWDGQYFPANPLTLFDFSSLTQIFTAAAFMKLADYDMIHLDDPVCAILRDFSGPRPLLDAYAQKTGETLTDQRLNASNIVDASAITFRQLLRHSSGLPPAGKLFRQAHHCAARQSLFNAGFSFIPDTDVQISDSALILLGWAIEALCKTDLSTAMDQLVLKPLGLQDISFRPLDLQRQVPLPLPAEGIAPTYDTLWRKSRLRGEVCDPNSAFFGGICGHAGLFGTAEALAIFGEAFLPGSDFLKTASLFEMTHPQTNMPEKQLFGLGFQLWSEDPSGSVLTPLSSESFGFSCPDGTCLLIDPMRELVIAFLTNEISNNASTMDSMNTSKNLSINTLWPKIVREISGDL